MSLTIQLPRFEGPLPLLLYLIKKEEMDIFNIKIHEITSQYLEYIKVMKELDLEVAGEFIAMAATLLQIKSRMLLPQYDENGEVIEQEDPRKELVQRLLEYQKYQEAAKSLYERTLLGRDVWSRGLREKLETADDGGIILEENALFALISSYRAALRNVKKKTHQVAAKLQSIASRVLEIKEFLFVGRQVSLSSLITKAENKRKQVLITFLSLLELAKMGFVSLYQSETYSEIYAEAKKAIENDAISRVEEYDRTATDDKLTSSMNAIAANPEQLDFIEGEDDITVVESSIEGKSEEDLEDQAYMSDEEFESELLAAEQELALDELKDTDNEIV